MSTGRTLLSAALMALTLSSCATKTQTGAAVGAAGGAAIGGAIAKATGGSTAKGAIMGAVVGGTAGAIIGARMDKQARELEQNIAGAKVERVGEGINVTFDSGLLYDFDSYVVRDNARTNLRSLATSLGSYPDSDLLIVGHTDDRGADGYNQTLSERRAQAAADYLVSQGVARSRIRTMGRGEVEPVSPNDNDAGRQANRRVEVAIFANEAARADAARQARP